MTQVESHLQRQKKLYNGKFASEQQSPNQMDRELDSQGQVKFLLKNLDKQGLNSQKAIIDQQAHLINYKKHTIKNTSGLRKLILTRNKFTTDFAIQLQQSLESDKYLKFIDLAGNQISEYGLKYLVKLALLENTSIVGFDARLNPGSSEKIQRQFALVMLKNIETMRAKGIPISEEWLVPQLYSYQIPKAIL
jgi:hypothetical protein